MWRRLGLDQLTITDPMGSVSKLAGAAVVLLPPGAPGGAVDGAAAAGGVGGDLIGLGRTVVLRRADPSLQARPLDIDGVAAGARGSAGGRAVAVWFALMMWASGVGGDGALEPG